MAIFADVVMRHDGVEFVKIEIVKMSERLRRIRLDCRKDEAACPQYPASIGKLGRTNGIGSRDGATEDAPLDLRISDDDPGEKQTFVVRVGNYDGSFHRRFRDVRRSTGDDAPKLRGSS